MKPFFVFVGILFLLFPSSSIGNPYPSQVKSYEGVFKYLPRHAREMLSSTVLFQTQTKTFQQANRSGTALLAPPANDNYSNREFIGGDSGTVSADNTEATIETGEPHHIPFPYAQNSIWYTWTAPYNGQFGFDTENSTFSTLLAAYTGSFLTNLSQVRINHPQHLSIYATAGTTYQIAVMGANPGEEGTVTLRYYPDTLSGWLPMQVFTNTYPNAVAVPDGSLAHAIETIIFGIFAKTNRFGYLVDFEMRIDSISQGVTIVDRKKKTIVLNAFPPGAGTHFSLMDFDGKQLLVYNWHTSQLFAYKVSRSGLSLINQKVVPHMQAAYLAGSCIYAYQVNFFSMIFPNTHSGVTVFDKKLNKTLWSISIEKGNIEMLVKGKTAYRHNYAEYSQTVDLYKNGKMTRRTLVPYSFNGNPETYLDSKGNILYWYSSGSIMQFQTNTPLTYVSSKGSILFSNQVLPDAGLVWRPGGFEKGRMYIIKPSSPDPNVIGYKVGKKIAKTGSLPISGYNFADLHDGQLTVYQALTPNTHGFTQYDKNIKKETWKENIINGYIDYIGKKTFMRTREIPGSGSTNFIFTIFNRKKTVGEHQILLN